MGKDKAKTQNPPAKKTKPPKNRQPPAKTGQVNVGNAPSDLRKLYDPAQAKRYREQLAKQRGLQEKLKKLHRRRLSSLTEPKCYPSFAVYGGKQGNEKNKWLCSIDGQIAYKETTYRALNCEIRVFIEGAEVTPYVRGSVSWSIQSTEGMNTCSFSLNNHNDAFIITPMNVCADLNIDGWNLARDKTGRVITGAGRQSRNTDEWAKYKIYREKYNRVKPGTDGQQIDESGMWLYPLNPYGCIFNKHDCVRVFYRLPHVSGAVKRNSKKQIIDARELWAPAFTGFIDAYDFSDDPVSGDRVISIKCYDYKGLLERMQVRIGGSPLSSGKGNAYKGSQGAVDKAIRDSEAFSVLKDLKLDDSWLRVVTDNNIATEFVSLFDVLFQNTLEAKCKKDNSNKFKKDCALQVYKEAKVNVQTDVVEFFKAYKDLEASLNKSNAIDKANRKIVQKPSTNGTLLVEKQNKGQDIDKLTNEIIAYLSPGGTGYKLVKAAEAFAEAFRSLPKATRDKSRFVINASPDMQEAFKYVTETYPTIANDYGLSKTGKSQLYGTVMFLYDKNPETVLVDAVYNNINSKFVSKLNQTPPKPVVTSTSSSNASSSVKPPKTTELSAHSYFLTVVFKYTKSPWDGGRIGGRIIGVDNKLQFNNTGVINNFIAALKDFKGNYVKQNVSEADNKNIPQALSALNVLLKRVRAKFKSATAKIARRNNQNPNARRNSQIAKVKDKLRKAKADGKNNKIKRTEAGNIADLFLRTARYDAQNAGMYQDLINALQRDSHPLAGMSYETAVQWLTLTHLPTSMGIEKNVKMYDKAKLSEWNKTILFGIVGRPLTYNEVTQMGKGTLTELDEDRGIFSPLQSFVHMLLPALGTGALTIVQQNIQANPAKAKEYSYQTRLSLLREISETLDYQFFVSPAGDLVFEFPFYNGLPSDWGNVFQGAYTVQAELKSAKITPETGPMNTGWILTGLENDKATEPATSKYAVLNQFKKIVLVAPMLARRVGVKTRDIQLKIPGIGAVISRGGGRIASLMAYGLLEVQRELGRATAMTVDYSFRPYMIPNRPLHLVPRQRIGMIKSVDYTMTPPDGDCTISTEVSYVRELFRDGTFRHVAGGTRMPVDYSSLFTGEVKYNIRYGATKEANARGLNNYAQALNNAYTASDGARKATMKSGWSCGPLLRDRYLEAGSSYGDQVDAQFRRASTYGGSTSGSQGQEGFLPPEVRINQSVGGRAYRIPPAPGAKSDAVTMRNTGLDNTSDNKPTGKRPKYDIRKKFNNPYPFGEANVQGNKYLNPFNNWGLNRLFTKDHYKTFHVWHSGIDIIADNGTEIYLPFDADSCKAEMTIGCTRHKTAWVAEGTVSKSVLENFAIKGKDGKPVRKFTGNARLTRVPIQTENGIVYIYQSEATYKYLVDNTMYTLYKKLKKKAGGRTPYLNPKGVGNKAGMTLRIYGYVSSPKDPNRKVRCMIRMAHISDVGKPPKSSSLYGFKGNSYTENMPKSGSVVAYVGNNGRSGGPHLHLEMVVLAPSKKGKGTDSDTFKDIIRANEEFLRTGMAMKLTGGKPQSNKLSKTWQNYFNSGNRKSLGITTVDEALGYIMNNSSFLGKGLKNKLKYLTNQNAAERAGQVWTNPFFFFKPEDFIRSVNYKEFNKLYSDRFYYKPVSEESYNSKSICGVNSGKEKAKIQQQYYSCLTVARRKKGRARKQGTSYCLRQFKGKIKSLNSKSNNPNTEQKIANRLNARIKKRAPDDRNEPQSPEPAS